MAIEDMLFPFTDEAHRPRTQRPKPANARSDRSDRPERTVTLRARAKRAIAEPLLRSLR